MNTQLLNEMYNKISPEEYKALVMDECKRMTFCEHTLGSLSIYIPVIAKEYIIDYIVDNNFNDIYRLMIDYASMNCEKDILILLNHMLKKFTDNYRINNDYIPLIFYMQSLFYKQFIIDKKLIKIIHDNYGERFFNDNIRKFEIVKQYCFTFCNCLTEEERNTIFKRLQTKTRHVYINDAMRLINFSEEQKQILQSILILDKFAT